MEKTKQHATCPRHGKRKFDTDPVWPRIFYFREERSEQQSVGEDRREKHRTDAGGQQRTRGAQNANLECLKRYGFLTSVAV